jgi:PAS domain S-box-containing protein
MSTLVPALDTTTPLAPAQQPEADASHVHVVQFYKERQGLLDSLTDLLGSALSHGEAAIVVAAKELREGLENGLSRRRIDTAKAAREGRYVPLDAHETLSQFMVDGLPNGALFAELIGETILQAKAAAGGPEASVAVFGEMVALLAADGNIEGALALERLWNDLAETHSFSLQCVYPLNQFSKAEHRHAFSKVCAEHSAVVLPERSPSAASKAEHLHSILVLQQKAEALEAEIALRRGEEWFRMFVEAVQDYAIFMLDAAGRVATWNKGAERIKGYKASEIIGKHFSVFYPEDAVQTRKPWWELEVVAEQGRIEDEGWRIRKDGSRFWANVIITAVRDEQGKLIGFGKVTRDLTERKQAEERLEQANEQLREQARDLEEAVGRVRDSEKSLRELTLQLLRSQDNERRRIGRDLHDSLGQYLSVLKLKLEFLLHTAEDHGDPQRNKEIRQCSTLADDCITEVRTLSHLLYPPLLEEIGLKSAVPWYLDGFAKRSRIKTSVEISMEMGRLPLDVELAMFRVLQEALTNVHRHSGSETARVRLEERDGCAVLEVADKGKGMPPAMLEALSQEDWAAAGVGMRGMNERIRQLGGRLEVRSDGTGTTVTATVPVENLSPSATTPDSAGSRA